MRLLVIALLLFALPALAQPARVASVHDGDTLRLEGGERVRLWGIDAPELKQPYGIQARDFLARLVEGKSVHLRLHGEDRYGRLLAEVELGGRSVNEMLLSAGLAWWFKRYTPAEKRYEQLEQKARQRRLGLWSEKSPLAPWDYRHR